MAEASTRKVKNIYKNKISSMLKSAGTDISFSANCELDKTLKQSKNTLSSFLTEEQRKAKRNESSRMAAKNARKRKKIYVKLLQQEIQKLERIKAQAEDLQKKNSVFLESLPNLQKNIDQDEIAHFLYKEQQSNNLEQSLKLKELCRQLKYLNETALTDNFKKTKKSAICPLLKRKRKAEAKDALDLLKQIHETNAILDNQVARTQLLSSEILENMENPKQNIIFECKKQDSIINIFEGEESQVSLKSEKSIPIQKIGYLRSVPNANEPYLDFERVHRLIDPIEQFLQNSLFN